MHGIHNRKVDNLYLPQQVTEQAIQSEASTS